MDTLKPYGADRSASAFAAKETGSEYGAETVSDFLANHREGLEELSGRMKSSVLSPLEETMEALAGAWREDASAAAFLARLSVHHENLLEAQEQLKAALEEL